MSEDRGSVSLRWLPSPRRNQEANRGSARRMRGCMFLLPTEQACSDRDGSRVILMEAFLFSVGVLTHSVQSHQTLPGTRFHTAREIFAQVLHMAAQTFIAAQRDFKTVSPLIRILHQSVCIPVPNKPTDRRATLAHGGAISRSSASKH